MARVLSDVCISSVLRLGHGLVISAVIFLVSCTHYRIPTNQPPTVASATFDNHGLPYSGPQVINLISLTGARDPEGDAISFRLNHVVAGGNVGTFAISGTVATFTPLPGIEGESIFEIVAADARGAVSNAVQVTFKNADTLPPALATPVLAPAGPTQGAVVVEINTTEKDEIAAPAGWIKLGSAGHWIYQRTYTSNVQNEIFTLEDRAGNIAHMVVNVDNINRIDELSAVLVPTFRDISTNGATIENHITDSDGVQNVTYLLFKDASATQPTASNILGVFQNLESGMAYWARTIAETWNATNRAWEQRVSPAAMFWTLALHRMTYVAGVGGTVSAETNQDVPQGGNAKPVLAAPNDGYTFKNWTDGLGWSSTENPLVLSGVTAPRTLTANFSKKSYAVHFSLEDGGMLTGAVDQMIEHGQDATAVTVEPYAGYAFTGWMEEASLITKDLTLAAKGVISNHSFTATFKKINLPLPLDYFGCSVVVASSAENVVLTLKDQSGGYEMEFGYSVAGQKVVLGNTEGLAFPIKYNLGKFAAGTELRFFINIPKQYTLASDYIYTSGEESGNPDGMIHDHFVLKPDGSWTLGFEDLYGGGDYDFDDIFFALEGPVRVRQLQKTTSINIQDVVLPSNMRSAGQIVEIPVVLSGLVRDDGAVDNELKTVVRFNSQQLTYMDYEQGDSWFDKSRISVSGSPEVKTIIYNLNGIGASGQLRNGTIMNIKFQLNSELLQGEKIWINFPEAPKTATPDYGYTISPSIQRMRPVRVVPGGFE